MINLDMEEQRAEWATLKPDALPYQTRRTPDGALVVKQYGGTATTDPMFYSLRSTVTAAGSNQVDLSNLVGGKLFQGIYFQVSGAKPGDTMEMHVHAGGPSGPVVQSFGAISAPMPTGSTTWGQREIMFGAAKQFPPAGGDLALVYALDYRATDADPRELLIDVLVHV